ncbi:MAG: ACT domain-containing protein [Proteobacteria bacterium]|nr:ACT domain-containing protein [Pseudomonadota bacterium]
MKKLVLSALPERLAVCRLGPDETVPDWVFSMSFWSITRTDEELSLIVPEEFVSPRWKADKGWRCFKALGPIDLSLTGIIASLSLPLAQAGVSIFAISTHDTDYLLVRNVDFDKARKVLVDQGHQFSP